MLTIYPDSELYGEIQRGNWQEETEIEKYKEIKALVENLNIPVWFGALGACLFLQPFASQTIKLYFATSIMATTMELVTAHLMIRFFGSFWWDYSHKWMNYKGIICFQSSVAWGFWASFSSASSMALYIAWWATYPAALKNGRLCVFWHFIFVILSTASAPSSTRTATVMSRCWGG